MRLIRVSYSKPEQPKELREYRINGKGPVGCINEYKKVFPGEMFEIEDAIEGDKRKLFKQYLCCWASERLGYLEDKQLNAIFDKAWEDGHSSGYCEVALLFDELLDLLELFIAKKKWLRWKKISILEYEEKSQMIARI